MQKNLLYKLGLIAGLSLLLMLPLSMIEGQIAARGARQAEVVRNIAESAAGAQTLVGPVLAVRYRERVERRTKDSATGQENVRYEVVEHTRILPPQRLDIGGEARVETRSRGIYSGRLYHLALQVAGTVTVRPRLDLDPSHELVSAEAILVLGLSDPRGVGNDPEVSINGQVHRFATGTAGLLAGPGLHVPLGEVNVVSGRSIDFDFPLDLSGSEQLAIAPAGNATTVSLKSDWQHPSFQGRFLPTTREIGVDGFTARWQVSHLARNFERVLQAGESRGTGETLNVSFVDPVNVYLQSERAVKYGILFVALTFAGFFLTETLQQSPIHPLQYLLVGLALAIFFLLLIALSEHIPFLLAYGLSAAACVALVAIYLAGALGSRLRAATFGAGIASLYGVLYGVLHSEDNALLMGTLLLFAALAATMLATRRIDWYRLGAPIDARTP